MEQGPDELSDDQGERADQLRELTEEPLDKEPMERDAKLPEPESRPEPDAGDPTG